MSGSVRRLGLPQESNSRHGVCVCPPLAETRATLLTSRLGLMSPGAGCWAVTGQPTDRYCVLLDF